LQSEFKKLVPGKKNKRAINPQGLNPYSHFLRLEVKRKDCSNLPWFGFSMGVRKKTATSIIAKLLKWPHSLKTLKS
jgi:hypothetical protein